MNSHLFISMWIFIINLILIICLIFFERRNPSVTWAWVLILTFIPFLGFIIYLFLGQNLSHQKMFNKKILYDKDKLDYMNNLKKNYLYDHNSLINKDIIEMNVNNAKAIYSQNNDVVLYFDGKDLFKDILKEIKNAKSFIHMEYYIFRTDDIGKELINLLTEKAKEGIEVKLLVDSMGNGINKNYAKKFTDAGGKLSVFFPSFFHYLNKRINYRNHRKIIVIDGNKAFLGGFNVGDEYLGNDAKIGYWRDSHLQIKGEAVTDLEERFLLDWTYAAKEDLQQDYKKYFFAANKIFYTHRVAMQIVSSGPDHLMQQIKNTYVKIINNAKKNVYIQTPYFVPDDSVYECLKIAALSGVDVRLMIPGKPDHLFMGWVANSYLEDLIKCGVKIYLYNNGFLHCKSIVSDSNICTIGTANMDIRSFSLNFETNAVIYNKNIAEKVEVQFLKDMNYCEELTMEKFKNRSFLSKFFEGICRLLSPIM